MTAAQDDPPVLDLLRSRLGIELVSVSADKVHARMPVTGNRQPAGLLAGGASIALAESIASQAAALHASELGKVAVGVEVNATHHRSARKGWVHATCSALHLGSRMATYEVVIADEDDYRLTTARVSCALIETKRSTLPASEVE